MADLINPLQSLIDQATTLKDSGQAKKYQDRIEPDSRKKVGSDSILVLDISGSMNNFCGCDRKIDILKRAISPLAGYRMLAFNSEAQWIATLSEMPEPCGGTALHLALTIAASVRPRQTLIVSDGEPDDRRQALASAKRLTGTISTLYVGSDSNHDAISFMSKLARLGCGTAHVQDLSVGPQALQQAIQRLLPQG